MSMTEQEMDAALAENVTRGFLVINDDGTYTMTEAGKNYVETKMGIVTIPRAEYEALRAAAAILETEHDYTCPFCRAIAALRAAGIPEGNRPND